MSNTPSTPDPSAGLRILGELIRLSMTLSLEEMLKQVAEKSTEVLGDTALIVLKSELEVAFCTDKDRLIQMLMTGVNLSVKAATSELLQDVMNKGESALVPNVPRVNLAPQLRLFVDEYGLLSMIVIPIRGKERTLGAFLSLSTAPKMLANDHLAVATVLADFTAMAIEHARLATTDALTGLYNRRFFDEVLGRETKRADRDLTTLSLLMIDADKFKGINEHGHHVGDKVLVHIVRNVVACVRYTDFAARWGGDEFAIVLPGTNAQGALRAAKEIVERVQSGNILQSLGYSGTTTVSIGIAEHRRGNPSATLVQNADQALFEAKRAGGNTIRIFNEDQQQS